MEIVSLERKGAAHKPSGQPDQRSWLQRAPVFALGFRPFYLLAACFAALAVPLWVLRYLGWLALPANVDLNWHMHEMLFGFIVTVVIGFLYTAGRNWTGLWTPRGGHLAALALVWLAGRLAMLLAPPLVAAVFDLIFLPLVAWPLYRVFKLSANYRNMVMVGLLALLTLANAVYHAAVLGWLDVSTMRPLHGALMIVVVIVCVMGGRVIPLFTANAVRGVRPIMHVRRDRVGMALTVAAAIAFVCAWPAPLTASLLTAAGVAQCIRLAGWKPHYTLRNPLLWILHLSYGWIAIGFLFLALAVLGLAVPSIGIHLLAIGALSGMIIGMITRTALGHTGRLLAAGRAETAMYVCLQLGVVARLAAALVQGEPRQIGLLLAMALWSLAFLLYLAVYGPYLLRARVDGGEG